MAKRQATGYLHLSPRTKTLSGGVMKYDVKLQEGEKNVVDLVGFGADSYSQVKTFSESKSPVKVQLFPPGQGFTKEVIRSRSEMRIASRKDVPFEYSAELLEYGCSSEKIPRTDINELHDETKFSTANMYSAAGKLRIGKDQPHLVPSIRKMVKDDVTLFDKTGTIGLAVFDSLIDKILGLDGQMVEIICVKKRKFHNTIHITTTPDTLINSIDDDPGITIPADFQLQKADEDTLLVEEIDSISKFNRYSACAHCCRKVADNCIREKSYDCDNCRETYRIKHLTSTFTVPMKINKVEYCASAAVINNLLGDIEEETDIRDKLLDLTNIKIVYNQHNCIISSMELKD